MEKKKRLGVVTRGDKKQPIWRGLKEGGERRRARAESSQLSYIADWGLGGVRPLVVSGLFGETETFQMLFFLFPRFNGSPSCLTSVWISKGGPP